MNFTSVINWCWMFMSELDPLQNGPCIRFIWI